MKSKIKSTPDLSANSLLHQQAIAAGKEHLYSWSYNVQDHLKGFTTDEIKNHLKNTAMPFSILLESWVSDLNISSAIRNANGFNAKQIYYIGNKKFNRRGLQGVANYSDVNWISTLDEVIRLKDQYRFVGCDNIKGSVPLTTYTWKPNSLIVMGCEGTGLTPTIQGLCDDMVAIPMMGSVRSFNCSSASAIVMYDYVSKYKG